MTVCKSRQPTYWITTLEKIFARCFKSTSISNIDIPGTPPWTHILKKGFFCCNIKTSWCWVRTPLRAKAPSDLLKYFLAVKIPWSKWFCFVQPLLKVKESGFWVCMEITKAQTKRRRDEAHPITRGKRKRRLLKNKSDTLIAVKLPTAYILKGPSW